MAILFFDNPQGIILVNGKLCDAASACVDKRFCIEYIPFNPALKPIICAIDGKAPILDDVAFIRHRGNYIVRFCPEKICKPCPNDVYLQKVLQPIDGAAHCLTCHSGNTHQISVETQNEMTTYEIPCKAADVKFSCQTISSGQLISVFSQLENCKTHVAILHYNDDYTTLLDLCCDEIDADESGLFVYDCLGDTLGRRCARKLRFCDDCFVEESRHFENSCSHSYIDEIIPYVFIESVCYGDKERVKDCLCSELRGCDFKNVLGDFIGICDPPSYKPYEVSLLYTDCDGLYTKSFCFSVSSGKIQKIKCL